MNTKWSYNQDYWYNKLMEEQSMSQNTYNEEDDLDLDSISPDIPQ